MNISEFHHERPRKTYQCIVELQKYTDNRIETLKLINTVNNDLYEIKDMLKTLKKHFLAGE